MSKYQYLALRIVVFMLIPILFFGLPDNAYAAKKKKVNRSTTKSSRTYYPKQTKASALETLRNGSGELSTLAGLSSEEDGEEEQAPATNFIERQYSNLYETDRDMTEADVEGEDLEELEAEDDVIIDVDNFRNMWMTFMFDGTGNPGDDMMYCGIAKQELMDNIIDWLGTPYLFGGTSRRAIDCSAFVRQMYRSIADIMLPRTANQQYGTGAKIKRDELEFGDLIFFHTREEVYVSHVGLYLGDNLFAHASSRYGVTVSSLESEYYNKRFIGARRMRPNDLQKYAIHKDQSYNGL